MIIAQRTLQITDANGTKTQVGVRILLPRLNGTSWVCEYEIDWPTATRRSSAGGVDSVQALTLAMQKVGTELYASPYHEARTLTFDGPGKGYGFPVPKPLRKDLIGEDAIFDGNV